MYGFSKQMMTLYYTIKLYLNVYCESQKQKIQVQILEMCIHVCGLLGNTIHITLSFLDRLGHNGFNTCAFRTYRHKLESLKEFLPCNVKSTESTVSAGWTSLQKQTNITDCKLSNFELWVDNNIHFCKPHIRKQMSFYIILLKRLWPIPIWCSLKTYCIEASAVSSVNSDEKKNNASLWYSALYRITQTF